MLLDWEGNITQPRDIAVRVVLYEAPEDEAMVAALYTSKEEGARVGKLGSSAAQCIQDWHDV